MAAKFRIALIQMLIGADKQTNIAKAISKISEAAKEGAQVIVLPESFNAPYGPQFFNDYAEIIPGHTTDKLSEVVKRLKVILIGGTIPERCQKTNKLYNSCPIFDPEGSLLGKFRKIHMFDVDVPGKITFKESDSLNPGSLPVIFKTKFCNIGIGICYDVRFDEFAEIYAQRDCQMLIYPSAFNMTTGPAHYELLARARAVQTQCYVALCSPARDPSASYVAWGHSVIVDPWGSVVASASEKEETIFADIDLGTLSDIRKMIPIRKQRRTDIYSTVCHADPLILG